MKKIVYVVAILAFLSILYYFIVFLPKARNYEMQQKCARSAQEFMKSQNFKEDSVKYECHFNKKLNKCFIRIDVTDRPFKTVVHSLVDVLENKDYGSCSEIDYKIAGCWMADQKHMGNYYDWKDASEVYMSE